MFQTGSMNFTESPTLSALHPDLSNSKGSIFCIMVVPTCVFPPHMPTESRVSGYMCRNRCLSVLVTRNRRTSFASAQSDSFCTHCAMRLLCKNQGNEPSILRFLFIFFVRPSFLPYETKKLHLQFLAVLFQNL